MRINKLYNRFQLYYICLVIAFVGTSCTKEDISACYNTPYTIMVRAYDADNNEITKTGDVKDVRLFIFDSEDKYINTQDATAGEVVELNYPDKTINVIAWGNSATESQSMPILNVGDKLETAFVTLKRRTKSELPVAESPDDLFFGSSKITEENRKTTTEIAITRKVSSIAITARNLKKYTNDESGIYEFRLRRSGDKRDFYGKPCGESISYSPQLTLDNKKDEITAPIFNILSTNIELELDVYHNNILIVTVYNCDGKPIKAEEGRVLNILIDFSSNISVNVSTTPWGKTQIWKEF